MRLTLLQLPFIMQLGKLSKRSKFVALCGVLSLGLFIAFNLSPEPRLILILALSFLSSLGLFFSLYQDIKGTFFLPLLVLPFLFTMAFGVFFDLLPARFLTRIILTIFFGVGTYAMYLVHNIYAVASSRTIKLLRAAHSTGLLLTFATYLFLANSIFSLHLFLPYNVLLTFLLSIFLILPTIWSVNLEIALTRMTIIFTILLGLVLAELALALNFWPATPIVAAIFLAGNFYALMGLSQAWFERRLFKNTLWEYLGVSIIVFLVLLTQTKWGG